MLCIPEVTKNCACLNPIKKGCGCKETGRTEFSRTSFDGFHNALRKHIHTRPGDQIYLKTNRYFNWFRLYTRIRSKQGGSGPPGGDGWDVSERTQPEKIDDPFNRNKETIVYREIKRANELLKFYTLEGASSHNLGGSNVRVHFTCYLTRRLLISSFRRSNHSRVEASK